VEIQQAEDALQFVVTIRTLAGYMQKEIDFGGRGESPEFCIGWTLVEARRLFPVRPSAR